MVDPMITNSREKIFDFLDEYAITRKEEIDQHDVKNKVGLIKSYVLESSANSLEANIGSAFANLGWRLNPTDSAGISALRVGGTNFGYLESISPRYMLVHTFQETKEADNSIAKVANSPQLDFLWLAGDFFNALWDTLILPQMPDRLVSFRFEHEGRFESMPLQSGLGVEDETENQDTGRLDAEEITERPVSTSTITEQARRIGRFLPELQRAHPPFNAIKMLRIPASSTRGGYDFWSWGKVTYRAPSFREGREQILAITNFYQETTNAIEKLLWIKAETVSFKEDKGGVLRGAPLTLQFSQELPLDTFRNLIDVSFEKGEGPLRLWGNPMWLSERKVHVYGIDLHLWQRIYMEITPRRMVVLLPEGTCGNTVHRLMTNVQRYVDPAVKMWIGDVDYLDLIHHALLGKIEG